MKVVQGEFHKAKTRLFNLGQLNSFRLYINLNCLLINKFFKNPDVSF
jgi:hypothetical protein